MKSTKILCTWGKGEENLKEGEIYTGLMEPMNIIFLYSGSLKKDNHYLSSSGHYGYGSCCGGVDIREATWEEKMTLRMTLEMKGIKLKNLAYELY